METMNFETNDFWLALNEPSKPEDPVIVSVYLLYYCCCLVNSWKTNFKCIYTIKI